MKFKNICLIVCVLSLSASPVIALDYQSIESEGMYHGLISQNTLYEANVLQTYILQYKEKIQSLTADSAGENSPFIYDIQSSLTHMSRVLELVKSENIRPENVTALMTQMVEDLKKLNSRLQIFLQENAQQKEADLLKLHTQLRIRIYPVSQSIDRMIFTISEPLLAKESLSRREKKIVEVLYSIQLHNKALAQFSTSYFDGEASMKSYLRDHIQAIGSLILELRKYL